MKALCDRQPAPDVHFCSLYVRTYRIGRTFVENIAKKVDSRNRAGPVFANALRFSKCPYLHVAHRREIRDEMLELAGDVLMDEQDLHGEILDAGGAGLPVAQAAQPGSQLKRGGREVCQ